MDVVLGTHQAPGMMFFFIPSKFLLHKITSWHHNSQTVLLDQKPVIYPSSIYLWTQRQGYWTHSSIISAPARYTIFLSRCLAQAMITLMKTWILFFPHYRLRQNFYEKAKVQVQKAMGALQPEIWIPMQLAAKGFDERSVLFSGRLIEDIHLFQLYIF